MEKRIHFEGLNGLRAMAVIAVVISHITNHLEFFGLNNGIFGYNKDGTSMGWQAGGFGVTIFFTLSGFLITYLLLNEQQIQPINIRNFYIRRILRIFPLYFLFLILTLFTYLLFNIRFELRALLQCMFFAGNVPTDISKKIPLLGHYWSLGVEEQFYLFLPFFLKYSKNRLLRNTIFLAVFLFGIRVICWIIYKNIGDFTLNYIIVTSRYHILVFGCLVAILYFQNNEEFINLVTKKSIQVLSWAVLLVICYNKVTFPLIHELVATATGCIIIAQITGKNKLINLETKVLDFVGRISFGIYITHNLIILYCSKLTGKFTNPSILNYLFVYVFVIIVVILMSVLSYNYFEKWFLKMKLRYTIIYNDVPQPENNDTTLTTFH